MLGCVGNDRRCQAIGLSRAAGGVAKAQTVIPPPRQKTKRPRRCCNGAEGKTSKRGRSWMHKEPTRRVGRVSTPGSGAFHSSSTVGNLPRSCTGSKASVPVAKWRNFSKNGRDEHERQTKMSCF